MSRGRERLHYVDHLKVLLAMLVVTVHVALSYGPEVWWFYKAGTQQDGMLAYYQIIGPFCMCLFFLLSAYFLPGSYDRKGAARFLKDRIIRLIIPLVLGFFIIIVPLHYLYHDQFRNCGTMSFWTYSYKMFFGIGGNPSMCEDPWLTVWPDLKVAHLWFLQHLLAYSLIYACLRTVFRSGSATSPAKPTFPKDLSIIGFTGLTALFVFAVRIKYPLEHWDGFLGFIQAEYGNFPKYVVFFVTGMVAYRKKWLHAIPIRQGIRWLVLGLVLFVAAMYGNARFPVVLARGGLNWEALVWSVWDCAMCIALSIGLVSVFRSVANGRGRLLDELSASTFGVYILHVPVVVFLQFALQNWQVSAGIKFVLESTFGILLAFLLTSLLRRMAWIRKII